MVLHVFFTDSGGLNLSQDTSLAVLLFVLLVNAVIIGALVQGFLGAE